MRRKDSSNGQRAHAGRQDKWLPFNSHRCGSKGGQAGGEASGSDEGLSRLHQKRVADWRTPHQVRTHRGRAKSRRPGYTLQAGGVRLHERPAQNHQSA